jgi:hypothetical protein
MSGGYGTDALDTISAPSGSGGTASLSAVVSLCNSALIMLGQELIASMTDASEAARLCRNKWPEVRDAVLREAKWRCLVKRAQLARLSETPAFGFLYAYQLPTDCYLVLGLSVATAAWGIEGKALLTDETQAFITYIGYDTQVDNVGLFDSLLSAAIVARMAAELAPSLKAADRFPTLWAAYERKLDLAKAAGRWEAPPEIISVTTFTTNVR